MGRIKTQLIKRLTFDIYRNNRERCSTVFDENKKITAELIGEASKKIRNSVAGYISRLVKAGKD